MGKYAFLDMYDYEFIMSLYDKTVIDTIELRFNPDELGEIASISTEISGYDDRIYLEGKRFKRVEETVSNTDNGLYLLIKVEELYNDEERIQQSRATKDRHRTTK